MSLTFGGAVAGFLCITAWGPVNPQPTTTATNEIPILSPVDPTCDSSCETEECLHGHEWLTTGVWEGWKDDSEGSHNCKSWMTAVGTRVGVRGPLQV